LLDSSVVSSQRCLVSFSHSVLLDPLTAALFHLPTAAAALRCRAAAPIGSNISASLNLRCVHNHVTSERCSGCARKLDLCSKLLLRSTDSSGSAQLNISVQLGLRCAQSHVMATRRLAPVSLVTWVSEPLDEAALCEWAAPKKTH